MLNTLAEDIKRQLKGGKGWKDLHTDYLVDYMKKLAQSRLEVEQKPRTEVSFSMLGMPCKKKLWYMVNKPELSSGVSLKSYGTFLIGDILEGVVLALAKAAGYDVQGEQDELEFMGVKGHRDAVINGITVDVKSTNMRGMMKFRKGALRKEDPFGYISQLSSYTAAAKDDPIVTDKTGGAFVVVQKDSFDIAVDYYNLEKEINNKSTEIRDVQMVLKGPIPKERLKPVPLRKDSKNTKLCVGCSFCEFKDDCWPEARIFNFSYGPEWLVNIVTEPRVKEIIR